MKQTHFFRSAFIFSVIFFVYLPGILVAQDSSPIPADSEQLVIVVTDSVKSTKGMLYFYERESEASDWHSELNNIPVVLGRSGLGWGVGLNEVPGSMPLPVKREGDGRSPAGVFRLGPVFGYKPANEVQSMKMPYLHVTEFTECIDDINSQLYNQIVSRDTVEMIDWNSSEKMRELGVYYELGVVVEHNTDSIINGSGSCIFLHNWARPDETMAGCTAMAPENLKNIVSYLDINRNPVLVQLSRELYNNLLGQWKLPMLPAKELP